MLIHLCKRFQPALELRADSSGCLLTFTDTIDAHGKAARDGAGWHVCPRR